MITCADMERRFDERNGQEKNDMEFRNLKLQYRMLKEDMDKAIMQVMSEADFISGMRVTELEKQLAEYVGVKYCISCGNGTDAITLALMAWKIGPGDAVFVPDFTFFSSGECPAYEGATPIFVDVYEDTFNMSAESLEDAIIRVKAEGKLVPKAIITVDLFGQPANYDKIKPVADKYGLKILEDGAQGFGGGIRKKRACSFGHISTTSFFPAKPLGCYGDGGAVFTDDARLAELIRSYRIHGKGKDKYDNVRIGMNSRLDTIQAAVLQVKFKAFIDYEIKAINEAAERYRVFLQDIVKTPTVPKGYRSSWAQYTVLLRDKEQRDGLQKYLQAQDIPSMIYYQKSMHKQTAFSGVKCVYTDLSVTDDICDRVLSLPLHPYMTEEDQDMVICAIKNFYQAAAHTNRNGRV